LKSTEELSLIRELPNDFSPPEGVEIHSQKTVINWYYNDIYHIYTIPDVEHTLEDAKMQTDLMKDLFGDEKVNVLLDIRSSQPLAFEARKHYGSEEGKRNNAYIAVIVSSAFNKALGNFLIGIFKSSLKTKLFLNVEDGISWFNAKK
jgi:hypothetical protein